MDINRRDFFKLAGAAAVAAVGSMTMNVGHAQAPVIGSTLVKKGTGSSAKVYYSK
ncbi:MAG: twin-arginine translocation signal domain-containing protein, partial [Selenomonadaceae bacterium]|nr:twin-arginine translocation signal domain-containing protein [Selenomonadaceae bacterium]